MRIRLGGLGLPSRSSRRTYPRAKVGAPSMIRTCDLLVRRAKQGDRTGQQQTAAPVFSNESDHLSQPGSTPNFYRLSVICQSFSSGCAGEGRTLRD